MVTDISGAHNYTRSYSRFKFHYRDHANNAIISGNKL
jgi:hypothetical protein